MALTGPAPKQTKRRQNPDTFAWVSVANEPFTGPSPELPPEWECSEATLAWWETVRRMPHCALWSDSDWQFALDTAIIHARFSESPLANAPELRLRSAKLGMTYEDRLKLRIRYVSDDEPAAKAEPSAKVSDLASKRRKRLTSA